VHFKLLGKGGKVGASKRGEVAKAMSSSREELKAKLLGRTEVMIDEMLQDERLHEKMTLSEIEQLIGVSEADFRQAALEEIIAMQQDTPMTCPLCGGQLENKGKHRKQVISLRGETCLERTYYQCQQCGHGYFPPR
jgi:NADH pyrophosphatase NudC (nudix superfamily)